MTSAQQEAFGAGRRPGERGFDPVAQALHWIVFLFLFVQFVVGWTMPEIQHNTPQQGLIDWHLSMGALLMVVAVLRIAWRLVHPSPPGPTMPLWQRRVARITHAALYGLLLAIPVPGWVAAGYFGYSVRLFGLFRLPALADHTMQWAREAGDVHAVLTTLLIGVVGLHVAGALYHYFILRDHVMQRMLPGT